MKLIYKVQNIEHNRNFKFESEEILNSRISEGDLGKLARWIRLENATEFELSREDDRKTVVDCPEYLTEELDENGIPTGNTILVPAQTHVEIHVPDDFTITTEDITLAYEEELKFKKNSLRKQYATDTIVYVNTIIQDWTTQDKITLLSREDVKTVLTFLNYGSIEQSLGLCQNLPTDAILTSDVKTKIINYLTNKVSEFNAKEW